MNASHRARPSLPRTLLASAGLALLAACGDAPAAPDSAPAAPGVVLIAPNLTFVTPVSAASSVEDALSAAFDRVDRFRFLVRRAHGGDIVVDTTLAVTPGQEEYDLSVEASGVAAGESLLVTVTAFEGTTLLFESDPIPVTAQSTRSASSPPAPVNVPLRYSGPGATAASVRVSPEALVLAPGGSASLAATVLDGGGASIADVPVAWSAGGSAVATVDDAGVVTAAGEGATEVTVTTPTGLSASAPVYVVAGEIAFVRSGSVFGRALAGGEEEGFGTGATPAWSPDGARLLVDRGGTVSDAGSGASLFEGASPSISPDGLKLAAEAGGAIVFANADGSNPTPGPTGATPVWLSAAELLVGGGSVERVRADGSGRTTIAPGSARWPALASSGAVAWVHDGDLIVDGGPALLGGVDSRPSWSPDGRWLVASSGGGLLLVPAGGSEPPVTLGLPGATDPAWKPAGALEAPPALVLAGLDPEDPAPGAPLDVLGSGFDWIIPTNNRVFFPGPEADVEAEVLAVSETLLRVTVPSSVVEGTIRVQTWTEQATLPFAPALGSVVVRARTPGDRAVPGVSVRLILGGVEVASGTTDEEGNLTFPGLDDATYTVSALAPTGFTLTSVPSTVTVQAGTSALVEIEASALVQTVTVVPELPDVPVGKNVTVKLDARDINGDPVTAFKSSSWSAVTADLIAGGKGLEGTLHGVFPSDGVEDARFRVFLNDQIFEFSATVRSRIEGSVGKVAPSAARTSPIPAAIQEDLAPAANVTVELVRDGAAVSSAATGADGRFRFDGLLAGPYTVRVANLPEGYVSSPVTVELGQALPAADVTLTIAPAPTGSGDIVVVNDWNIWDTNTNPPLLAQNLVESAPNEGTKVVWWCGRQGAPSGTALTGGICAASIQPDGSGQFQGTRDAITAAGWSLEVDVQTPLETIGSDVRVFWLWTPTEQLTDGEVNVLKSFAARGGRIVFNSDFRESWYTTAQHQNIETRLLQQLGTGITSTGDLRGSSGVIVAPGHPILDGVTSVSFGSPGDMAVSSPGVSLVTDSGGFTLMGWAPVDSAPLAVSPSIMAPGPFRALATFGPIRPPLPTGCTPGTVCR